MKKNSKKHNARLLYAAREEHNELYYYKRYRKTLVHRSRSAEFHGSIINSNRIHECMFVTGRIIVFTDVLFGCFFFKRKQSDVNLNSHPCIVKCTFAPLHYDIFF